MLLPLVFAGLLAVSVGLTLLAETRHRDDRESEALAAFSMLRDYVGRAQTLGPGLTGQAPPFRHLPVDASPLEVSWFVVGDRDGDSVPDCDPIANVNTGEHPRVACDCDLSVNTDPATPLSTDDNDGLSDGDGSTRCLRVEWDEMDQWSQRAMVQYIEGWSGRAMPAGATAWLSTWEALPVTEPERLRRLPVREHEPETAAMRATMEFASGTTVLFCPDCLDPNHPTSYTPGAADPPQPPPTLVTERLGVSGDVEIIGDVVSFRSAERVTSTRPPGIPDWIRSFRTFPATEPAKLEAVSTGEGLLAGDPQADDGDPTTLDFGCPTCILSTRGLTVEDAWSHSQALTIPTVTARQDVTANALTMTGRPFRPEQLDLTLPGVALGTASLSAIRLCGAPSCPRLSPPLSGTAVQLNVSGAVSAQTVATGVTEGRNVSLAADLVVGGSVTAGTVFYDGDLCAGDGLFTSWSLC